MMLYVENLKDSTKELLDLINEFDKIAEYTVNTQNLVVLLYTNNELSVREAKKTIPCTIATAERCQEINLTKEVIDLYLENNRTLKKESGT